MFLYVYLSIGFKCFNIVGFLFLRCDLLCLFLAALVAFMREERWSLNFSEEIKINKQILSDIKKILTVYHCNQLKIQPSVSKLLSWSLILSTLQK